MCLAQDLLDLTVKPHARVRVEVGIHEHRRKQVRNPRSGEGWSVAAFLRRAVKLLVRCAQNRGDLALEMHAQIGVNVWIHEHGSDEIHQPSILAAELTFLLFAVHNRTPVRLSN